MTLLTNVLQSSHRPEQKWAFKYTVFFTDITFGASAIQTTATMIKIILTF